MPQDEHRILVRKGSNYIPKLSNEDEVNLKRAISVELEESEKLVKNLKNGMELIFRLIRSFVVFRTRFKNFFREGRKISKAVAFSESLSGKIEKYTSVFYALKSYMQAAGFILAFTAPWDQAKAIGLATAGGVFAVDYIFDWIAGIPQTRRFAISSKNFFRSRILRLEVIANDEKNRSQRIREQLEASFRDTH